MQDLLLTKLEKIQADISELKLLKKDVLSFKETCEYLQVSASNLYKLTCKKLIPHFCPMGKKLYFKRVELDDWLLTNKKGVINQDEIESIAANYLLKNSIKKGGMA